MNGQNSINDRGSMAIISTKEEIVDIEDRRLVRHYTMPAECMPLSLWHPIPIF